VTRPVQTEDIADGAVTQAKLGEGLSVQHADEADNADKVDGKDAADFAAADHNHDALYVNEGQPDSVTSPMIADGEVRTGDLADAAVTQAKIASGLSVQHAVEADHAARAAVADEALHARDSDMLGGIPAEGFVAKGEPGCISAEMLQDGSVAQGAIAFGAVTTETRGRSPAIRSFFVALSRNLQNADVCTVPAGVTLIITDIHWAYQIDQGNTTYMYVRDKTAGNDLFVGSGRNSGGNVQEDLMYSFQAGIVVPEGHTLEVTSTSTSQYLYVQFITISGYEIAPEG
jgi:hypothetical protein